MTADQARLQAAFNAFMATAREVLTLGVMQNALTFIGNNDIAALLYDACNTINPGAGEAREAIAALREQQAIGPVAPRICAMLRSEIASARQRMREAMREFREARETMAQHEKRTARAYARIIIGRPIFGRDAHETV